MMCNILNSATGAEKKYFYFVPVGLMVKVLNALNISHVTKCWYL